jgi:signal transduction histidine kinase
VRWLLLARGVWLALVTLTLTIFFASLPVYIAQLHTPCAGPVCWFSQLSPGQIGALKGMGLSLGDYAAYMVTLTLASVVLGLVVSTLIVWHRSRDRMALLVALMLVTAGPIIATNSVSASPSPWRVPNECLAFLALSLLVLVLLLFPSGQFVPHWIRWTPVVFLAGLVPTAFVAPLMPNTLVEWLTYLMSLGVLATVVLVQLYRYRRVSSPRERQQTKWMVFGLAVPITVDVIVTVPYLIFPVLASRSSLYLLAHNVVFPFLPLFLPLSLGFAILRSRLWDIDVLINRTLVYALLTASTLGLYVLVVFGASALLRAQNDVFFSLLATALIAVLFQPLRQWLQHGVNRLMFGDRNEPYRVLSRLGRRLEESLPAASVLPTIVETVAHALKLPYVAIAWKREQPSPGAESPLLVAAFGTSGGGRAVTRVPLIHQGKHLGDLVLSPRGRGEELTPADLRLVRDLAPQIGMALHSALLLTDLHQMTVDLQRSRVRLVTAREEERRRLRRDLHDGLGPQLSSQPLTLSAIKKLLRQDPETAEHLLTDAITHAQEAIADIRRLVYALRPPALDDLGLLQALQEQIHQYEALGIVLTLDAPEALPLLPAAIEMACYRIVQEALTNVVRHAHATEASVQLRVQEALVVEVTDNGQGLPAGVRSGVGLSSMRERAEELGGTCLIEARASGGTRVYARLPLLVGRHEENEAAKPEEGV